MRARSTGGARLCRMPVAHSTSLATTRCHPGLQCAFPTLRPDAQRALFMRRRAARSVRRLWMAQKPVRGAARPPTDRPPCAHRLRPQYVDRVRVQQRAWPAHSPAGWQRPRQRTIQLYTGAGGDCEILAEESRPLFSSLLLKSTTLMHLGS